MLSGDEIYKLEEAEKKRQLLSQKIFQVRKELAAKIGNNLQDNGVMVTRHAFGQALSLKDSTINEVEELLRQAQTKLELIENDE